MPQHHSYARQSERISLQRKVLLGESPSLLQSVAGGYIMYKLANKMFRALWRLGHYDAYTQSMIYIMLGFSVFLLIG
jgi:hypothetical protein